MIFVSQLHYHENQMSMQIVKYYLNVMITALINVEMSDNVNYNIYLFMNDYHSF